MSAEGDADVCYPYYTTAAKEKISLSLHSYHRFCIFLAVKRNKSLEFHTEMWYNIGYTHRIASGNIILHISHN